MNNNIISNTSGRKGFLFFRRCFLNVITADKMITCSIFNSISAVFKRGTPHNIPESPGVMTCA